MKKFYEAPVAEELFAEAAALLHEDGPILSGLSGGSDESGEDLDWDLL